ncbi:glycosyltransferase family 4 protein [Clostridium sp. E02]|uniref:glycosyltransferase family 4 protein n=1 Tax=Clostridium sp. E02 TaxID=2487134 RepID=UPI000F53B728|nr:glycosyltransferase family 4 protein [Clostridium sp. E02]
MKKKIAIVNQRYGAKVNGGSEYYTKKLAEHLSEYYDVEVLTTTALDYDTWESYYQEGEQVIDEILVRRFSIKKPRNIMAFKIINKLVQLLPLLWRLLEPIWIYAQGPYCPDLIRYIKNHKNEYDCFIFVTYLYYTTAVGLPYVADKAIFVPTAHDEYCIYFHAYEKLFKTPKGIIYLTGEEKDFVELLFQNKSVPHQVAGSGIEIPDRVYAGSFREKYQIETDYVIYVGRVDTSKKCDKLFEYFTQFNKQKQSDLKLVVVGKVMMEEPETKCIRCLGFVSEEDKYSAIAGAKALVMPSEHESLSLVVLEAMAMGVPVVVNGACAVLKGHCEKSGAGITYNNYQQFEEALEFLLKNEVEYEKMQYYGKKYIEENYSWDKTIDKYKMILG